MAARAGFANETFLRMICCIFTLEAL